MIPLVLTSACFMIPVIKGYRRGKRLMPTINAATSIVSMNYWRNPCDGIRREIDFTLAKTNFLLHVMQARRKDVPLGIIMGWFWWNSTSGGPRWPVWHGLFHGTVIAGMERIGAQ